MASLDTITSEAAGRYASALLELAEEAKALKTVERDVKTLKNLLAKSEDLRTLAASPVLPNAQKAKALLTVAQKAKLGKLICNFIGTVCANSRAGELADMARAFENMLAAKRGAQTALVTSAKKLSADELQSIAARLKKSLGRDVSIQTEINPELLGGFAVKIGSRYLDATLKTKLDGLTLALKEA